MELNVWTSTNIKSASYDDAKAEWTVVLLRGDGSERTFHPHHLVWCTGHSGELCIPSFPGQESFEGEVYHACQHKDATTCNVKGKKVVIVGTGTTGHDIAQEFSENGADVTMLQRSPTYVIQANKGLTALLAGSYCENGYAPKIPFTPFLLFIEQAARKRSTRSDSI
jgi:cation diffusion facilitator CzcD-associated flavoprotein CzcO